MVSFSSQMSSRNDEPNMTQNYTQNYGPKKCHQFIPKTRTVGVPVPSVPSVPSFCTPGHPYPGTVVKKLSNISQHADHHSGIPTITRSAPFSAPAGGRAPPLHPARRRRAPRGS
jgi:hypothetical protein